MTLQEPEREDWKGGVVDPVSEQGQDDNVDEKPMDSPGREIGLLEELFAFLRVRKRLWLAPIVLVLALLGLLFALAGSSGVLAPFLYAL